DDSGLAAACAGENQHGTFCCFNGFELFGIEKFREIHTLYGATKRHKRHKSFCEFCAPCGYSTVTLFARLRGWSISQPRRTAHWVRVSFLPRDSLRRGCRKVL